MTRNTDDRQFNEWQAALAEREAQEFDLEPDSLLLPALRYTEPPLVPPPPCRGPVRLIQFRAEPPRRVLWAWGAVFWPAAVLLACLCCALLGAWVSGGLK